MKEKTIEEILDKYSAKLIRIMRLEKDVEDAVIKSDLLQMEAAHEIKELIKAKLPSVEELFEILDNNQHLLKKELAQAIHKRLEEL